MAPRREPRKSSVELLSAEELGRLQALDVEVQQLQRALTPNLHDVLQQVEAEVEEEKADSPEAPPAADSRTPSPSNTLSPGSASVEAFKVSTEDLHKRLQVQEAQMRFVSARLEEKEQLWTELLRKKDEQMTLVLKREKTAVDKMRWRIRRLEEQLDELRKERDALEAGPGEGDRKRGEALTAKLREQSDRHIRTLQSDQHRLIAEFRGVKVQDMRLFLAKTTQQGAPEGGDHDHAPTGEVTLVFTDVQSSTYLWDQATTDMMTALQLHNSLLRRLIKENRGYEVKTEGDAFMVAFGYADNACNWALRVQTCLLEELWPEGLLKFPDAAEEEVDGKIVWRGLRVRVGIHFGKPACEPDPLTKRMDYFGPMVNQAARVAGSARGGEIVCSGEVIGQLMTMFTAQRLACEQEHLGRKNFKGLSESIDCWRLVPNQLRRRPFPERMPDAGPDDAANHPESFMTFLEWVVREEQKRDEEPPQGSVALVFTDVQGSTALWDKEPDAMWRALNMHNEVMRHLIKVTHGYEVKTEGDAFMVAFHDCLSAVRFAKTAQIELLSVDWPEELLQHDAAQKGTDPRGRVIWNGLRVRMGVHLGSPENMRDPVTKRMDYFGPMVNLAARVGGAAQGGELVCSAPVHEVLLQSGSQFEELDVNLVPLGEHTFKGVSAPMEVYRVVPRPLQHREFQSKAQAPPASPKADPFLKMAQKGCSNVAVPMEDAVVMWSACGEVADIINFLSDGSAARQGSSQKRDRRGSGDRSPEAGATAAVAQPDAEGGPRGRPRSGSRPSIAARRASGSSPGPVQGRGSGGGGGGRSVRQAMREHPHARRAPKDKVSAEDMRGVSREVADCNEYMLSLYDGIVRRALKGFNPSEQWQVAFGSTISPRRRKSITGEDDEADPRRSPRAPPSNPRRDTFSASSFDTGVGRRPKENREPASAGVHRRGSKESNRTSSVGSTGSMSAGLRQDTQESLRSPAVPPSLPGNDSLALRRPPQAPSADPSQRQAAVAAQRPRTSSSASPSSVRSRKRPSFDHGERTSGELRASARAPGIASPTTTHLQLTAHDLADSIPADDFATRQSSTTNWGEKPLPTPIRARQHVTHGFHGRNSADSPTGGLTIRGTARWSDAGDSLGLSRKSSGGVAAKAHTPAQPLHGAAERPRSALPADVVPDVTPAEQQVDPPVQPHPGMVPAPPRSARGSQDQQQQPLAVVRYESPRPQVGRPPSQPPAGPAGATPAQTPHRDPVERTPALSELSLPPSQGPAVRRASLPGGGGPARRAAESAGATRARKGSAPSFPLLVPGAGAPPSPGRGPRPPSQGGPASAGRSPRARRQTVPVRLGRSGLVSQTGAHDDASALSLHRKESQQSNPGFNSTMPMRGSSGEDTLDAVIASLGDA
eukprot:TRINITY_DN109_c0_g1_i1.p1 TRINITY_DN109_c0_g1~~TRINITY_DN109_c0_g1_i1.p1  ORF type:complete len:1426 (+),score=348.71 TRINITY_DN109_c0_g1_i1:110-4279(+)